MSFLAPWVAVAVAAVVVPALLILYFLKLRRREEPIASTLLWKRAVQDLQVNAPFQRLRKNLLLFLQLLILLLAILALARPIVQTTAADADRLVLLIDHSASMNTREADGQTRLQLAKEQAIRLAKTLNRRTGGWLSFLHLGGAEARTQAMVIAFAERASIVSPFTTNTNDLIDLIERIEPTDGQTDMREALELAEAYMAPPTRTTDKTPISAETPSKLVLVSDGRIANAEKLTLRSGTMELLRVGETRDNVGITTLRTQRNYEQPEMLGVFLTVKNFGSAPIKSDVSIYVDGTLAAVKPLELAGRGDSDPATPASADDAGTGAGTAASLSFDLPLAKAATIEARLSRDDALGVDNRAYAIVPPPRKLRVLVVTENNFFLDSVLAGLPLAEYPFIKPAEWEANAGDRFAADGQCKYDVVIFDKYQPDRLPVGNYLFLAATPKLDAFKVGEKLSSFALIWWDETQPVLRHVGLDPVVVNEAFTLNLPPQAESLIEGPKGPVLARYAENGRHCMVLTFAIEQSNWWSKPSFPVFMYNVIRYLGSGGAEVEAGPVRPGATLRIPVPAGTSEVRLHSPDASTTTLRPDGAGIAYFGDTDEVGVYSVDDGLPDRDRYAVNLEDEWESDITPPAAVLHVGSQEVAQLEAIHTATPEVWRWFVGAALALLLLEWWIYNRRVMI